MYKIDIKPFSVNDTKLAVCKTCQRSRKKAQIQFVSTKEYKEYEQILNFRLGEHELPMINPKEKLYIIMETTFKTQGSDWDNPIKPLQDILSEYLNFNDNQIQMGFSRKRVVDKKKDEEPSIRFMIYKEGEKDDFIKTISELSEDLK